MPAYNAEKTIARTIESILHQTDDRYKLILINDGSTDGTDGICRDYAAARTDKISYVFQENRGLGGARNHGMQLADTPYVSFLDSDDWLMPQFVERILWYLEHCADPGVEMILTLPVIFHEGSGAVGDWYDKTLFEKVFAQDGNVVNPAQHMELYRFEVNQCRKILRMDFVRRIHFTFREKVKWEDIYPHFYLLSQCTSCMGLGEVGFYYRIGNASQITASRGKDRLDFLIVFDDLLQYVDREGKKELLYPVMRVLIRFAIWCIRMADTDHRRLLVKKTHQLFRKLPWEYYRALLTGIRGSCSKADARQYLLFLAAIRFRPLNFIFYDYLWQDLCEKMIKKLLGAGERVA